MRRVSRTHLAVLLALAVGWIVRDFAGDGTGIVPEAVAQGQDAFFYEPSGRPFTLFTVGAGGDTLVGWQFHGSKENTPGLPNFIESRVYRAR